MNAAPTEKGYSEAVRSVALKAAEAGMRVDICPIANGGIGTAYAVTCAKEGRFEWLKGRKIPAYLKDVLLGILPGHTVIWDCAALNAVNGQPESTDLFGEALKAIMDLGYRNIVFAVDGFSDQGSVSNFILEKTDPRLIDCSFTVLTSNAAMINGKIVSKGTVWELIRMGASLRYAPEYVSEALRLPERGKAADKILLEQDPVPGVTSVFRSVFGDQKCTIIPSGSQDPDELDRLFE